MLWTLRGPPGGPVSALPGKSGTAGADAHLKPAMRHLRIGRADFYSLRAGPSVPRVR